MNRFKHTLYRIRKKISETADLVTLVMLVLLFVFAPITIIYYSYSERTTYDAEAQMLKESTELKYMLENNAMKSYRIYHDFDDTYRAVIITDNDNQKFMAIINRRDMRVLFCINMSEQIAIGETYDVTLRR